MTALSPARPIAIAISAMGGQGGGVLAQWIVSLAERQGWTAQSTSVPGVAQRTGATLYYIEMIEARGGATPVLSLMPAPGDVDIVLAAELMEAGRAMLRGLVTPDRTLLIASTHRSLAVSEKQGPGERGGESKAVVEAAQFAARRVIAFDMDALAKRAGSVISACLFGALSGSRALPFARDDFEAVIRQSGKGIEPSLRAFASAFERAEAITAPSLPLAPQKLFMPLPARTANSRLNILLERIRGDFPVPIHATLFAGIARLVDYQDTDYAAEYLDQAARFSKFDSGERGWALSLAAAKHIARAMAYDDVISVADLIAYRRRTERQVERVLETPFNSAYGGRFRMVIYRNSIDQTEHVVLTRGKIVADKPTLVRMHRVDLATDMLGAIETRREYVPRALKQLAEHQGAVGVAVRVLQHLALARAAGPHQEDELAGVYVEVHPL